MSSWMTGSGGKETPEIWQQLRLCRVECAPLLLLTLLLLLLAGQAAGLSARLSAVACLAERMKLATATQTNRREPTGIGQRKPRSWQWRRCGRGRVLCARTISWCPPVSSQAGRKNGWLAAGESGQRRIGAKLPAREILQVVGHLKRAAQASDGGSGKPLVRVEFLCVAKCVCVCVFVRSAGGCIKMLARLASLCCRTRPKKTFPSSSDCRTYSHRPLEQ
jgi:hypothetical protein